MRADCLCEGGGELEIIESFLDDDEGLVRGAERLTTPRSPAGAATVSAAAWRGAGPPRAAQSWAQFDRIGVRAPQPRARPGLRGAARLLHPLRAGWNSEPLHAAPCTVRRGEGAVRKLASQLSRTNYRLLCPSCHMRDAAIIIIMRALISHKWW